MARVKVIYVLNNVAGLGVIGNESLRCWPHYLELENKARNPEATFKIREAILLPTQHEIEGVKKRRFKMARTTPTQDHEFEKALSENINVDASFVLDFVADNFGPEDVFDYDVLVAWAEDAGIKEVT